MSPGRYAFHDLLRAYAAELGTANDSCADRRQASHRMFDHYLATVHAAALTLPSFEIASPPKPQPGTTVEELTDSLNPNRLPQFEAVATVGYGVFDTLKAIAKLVLMELKKAAP